MPYLCHKCEGIVEFKYFVDLCLHYQNHHPLLWCYGCLHLSATVEEQKFHIKTSPHHFCCQICEDVVEFQSTYSLHLHHRNCHPLLYCSTCDYCSKSAEDLKYHIKFSPLHYCCQRCEEAVEFKNGFELRSHYKYRHPLSWCHSCEHYLPTFDELFVHMQHFHDHCDGCHGYFSSPISLIAHRIICEKVNPPMKEEDPEPRERKPNAIMLRNHYATLGISPDSSHEEVLKAAKQMRIKMHPDRLKRQGGLTEEQERKIDVEAALVGQAADILSDLDLRREYDKKLRQ